MTTGVTLASVDRDFKNVAQRDRESTSSLWVERLFGRQISLSVSYDYDERSGENTFSYNENTIRVMVQYALNGTTTDTNVR